MLWNYEQLKTPLYTTNIRKQAQTTHGHNNTTQIARRPNNFLSSHSLSKLI